MNSPVGENLNGHVYTDIDGNVILPKATKIVLADGSEITSEDSAVNVAPVGTAEQIEVDDADPAAPVFSLASEVTEAIAAAAPLTNDLTLAALITAHPPATNGGKIAITSDEGLVISNGTDYVSLDTTAIE